MWGWSVLIWGCRDGWFKGWTCMVFRYRGKPYKLCQKPSFFVTLIAILGLS
jgi:hypothetical protein